MLTAGVMAQKGCSALCGAHATISTTAQFPAVMCSFARAQEGKLWGRWRAGGVVCLGVRLVECVSVVVVLIRCGAFHSKAKCNMYM